MAGVVVPESVTLAGLAERARVARAFVSGVLGRGHPCEEAAALLVSELFGNSVGIAAQVPRARRSRLRSRWKTMLSGSRSLTGAAPESRN